VQYSGFVVECKKLVVEGNGNIPDVVVGIVVAAVEEGSRCWMGTVEGCRWCMAGNCTQYGDVDCIGVGGSRERLFGGAGEVWMMKCRPLAGCGKGVEFCGGGRSFGSLGGCTKELGVDPSMIGLGFGGGGGGVVNFGCCESVVVELGGVG
jgi:hypothetical protein